MIKGNYLLSKIKYFKKKKYKQNYRGFLNEILINLNSMRVNFQKSEMKKVFSQR